MSFGKSSSKNQSQSTSQSTQNPAILAALLGNYGSTERFAGGDTYSPLTASQIQGYESPYTSSVINATTAALQNQTSQQIAQGDLSASASGAFNGDRVGVQDAVTQNLANQNLASTTATLENQGYQTALGTAQTENTAQNQFPIVLRQLVNQSLGLAGDPSDSTSQSTGSGSSSSVNGAVSIPNINFGG